MRLHPSGGEKKIGFQRLSVEAKDESIHRLGQGQQAVIVVGVLIAAFLSSTIGLIVAAVGVVGLILAAVSGRSRATI